MRAGTLARESPSPATRVTRPHLHPGLIIGGLLLLLLVGAATLAPLVTSYDPEAQDFEQILEAPSASHLFGTDNFGRDVFTRVLYGARIDLRIGVLAVVFPFLFGSLLGAAAGYYSGWVDTLVMRTVDVIIAVPFLVLVIAIVAFLGPGEVNIFIAIGGVGWVHYARLVRGEVLREKNLEYVAAARALGFRRWRIILAHILPNAIAPAFIYLTSDVVLVILTTSALGFLGLGVRPPAPEWGMMIADGREFLANAWWVATMPGFACMYTGLTFIVLGDGIADLLRVRGQ
jgi:peptide/nickel transport system permease protein